MKLLYCVVLRLRRFAPPLSMTLLVSALLAPALAARAASPVVPEDIFKMTFLSNALISPDGAHVLVTASKANGPKDSYDRTIDLVDIASGKLTANITGRPGDGDYAWMPDSTSFVFVRHLPKQKGQLYRYTLTTRASTALTHFKQGVSSPAVSHDGKRIALSVDDADSAPNAYVDFAKAGFTPTAEQKKTDIHVIDALFFEGNGQGYVYQDHPHIWTIAADGSHPKQLTSGKWGEGFDAWSPDDRTIVFDSLRYETVDNGPSDVYVMPSEGGTPQKLASNEISNNGLFFSSDGSRLYTFQAGVKDAAENAALISSKADGSDARVVVAKDQGTWGDSLLADMKEGGGFCAWPLPDGGLLLNRDGPGYANLRILDPATGAFRDLTPPRGESWSCSISNDGKTAAYLYSDFTHPADLYAIGVGTGNARQLTHVNAAYLASVTLSTPQALSVKDPAGFSVQTWFMPASGGKSGPKHPTLLNIHGGPETQFGDTYFMEFQYLASMGYNVVFCDPAGSTGHGYAFEEALESNYGDAMFNDVQAAMDAAVMRPDVDASRLGVMGGSYGGYATLWVISHTDRYKAAVAERAVSFLQSENLAADFAGKNGLGGGYYTWGPPWDPASTLYAKFSPLTYVANVHTPVLILHADYDTRAPIDQTLQEFTALKVLRRTAEYVAVPDENHDLSRTGAPIHRVERLHLIGEWMNKYLNP
ncbi:MAG: S9 family peptidase [Candidatus Eremiobacteraeota bacterium]|nr:S9 family peptidase [Candidatus Eremiobacteraeota bacterium]MBV8372830.1 S9 family peptidase [Candidatus Eremiobacteraeota bacterium]